jgi:hypothetical protein
MKTRVYDLPASNSETEYSWVYLLKMSAMLLCHIVAIISETTFEQQYLQNLSTFINLSSKC